MTDSTDDKDMTSIEDFSKKLGENSSESNEPAVDFAPIESSFAPPPASEQNSAILVAPPELEPPSAPALSGLFNNAPETGPLDEIKNYSEQLPGAKESIPASFPFSLLLEGELTLDEKDKLLEIVSHEKMGISAVDLEPQLEGTRILIPRISEYAGVLLAQALRSAKISIKLAPADEIFASTSTQTQTDERLASLTSDKKKTAVQATSSHPAETLPVSAGASMPELQKFKVIDVITASASIKTSLVEAESSREYQEAFEALQRELKYKAYHKSAFAILNFSSELKTLNLPSQYRLTVYGTAVKKSEA